MQYSAADNGLSHAEQALLQIHKPSSHLLFAVELEEQRSSQNRQAANTQEGQLESLQHRFTLTTVKPPSSAPAAATPRLMESCTTTDNRLLPLLASS